MEKWLEALHIESMPWPSIWKLLGTQGQLIDHDQIVLELEKADATFREGLHRVFLEIALQGDANWDTELPGILAIARIRIEAAYVWVCDLQTGRPERPYSPVPFPDSFERLTLWLLEDWWEDNGRDRAADAALDILR